MKQEYSCKLQAARYKQIQRHRGKKAKSQKQKCICFWPSALGLNMRGACSVQRAALLYYLRSIGCNDCSPIMSMSFTFSGNQTIISPFPRLAQA
jgi:hypothetical protein